MIQKQQWMIFSPYMALYDLIVPREKILRQKNELVDFSLIYDGITDKYCYDNGRNAVDLIWMFKYLLLKALSKVKPLLSMRPIQKPGITICHLKKR